MTRDITWPVFLVEVYEDIILGLTLWCFVYWIGRMKKPVCALLFCIFYLGIGGSCCYLYVPQLISMPIALFSFFAFILIFHEGNVKEKLLIFFAHYATVTLVEMTIYFFLSVLGFTTDDSLLELASFVLFTLSGFPLLYIIAKVWASISFTVERGAIRRFLLLPLSQLAMLIMIVVYFNKNPISGSTNALEITTDQFMSAGFMVITSLSLMADGVLLNSFVKTAESIREREQMKALEYENAHIYEYVKNLEGYISEMRRYRHDMLNLLSTVRYAVSESEKNGALDALALVDETTDHMRSLNVRSYCKSNFVNCILAHEEDKAISAGMQCCIYAVLPEELKVSEFDICRVLTNMMDNAIAGCCEANRDEDKIIYVDLRIIDGFLYIQVCNPTSGKVSDYHTKKNDNINHGLGLKIIKDISEANEGALLVDSKDETVTVTVTMKWGNG